MMLGHLNPVMKRDYLIVRMFTAISFPMFLVRHLPSALFFKPPTFRPLPTDITSHYVSAYIYRLNVPHGCKCDLLIFTLVSFVYPRFDDVASLRWAFVIIIRHIFIIAKLGCKIATQVHAVLFDITTTTRPC